MSAIDVFAAAVATQQRAYAIADAAVLADIETEGVPHQRDGCNWHDVLAMLCVEECGAAQVDMFTQALQYACDRGLIYVHPQAPHLVRIVRRTGRNAAD